MTSSRTQDLPIFHAIFILGGTSLMLATLMVTRWLTYCQEGNAKHHHHEIPSASTQMEKIVEIDHPEGW